MAICVNCGREIKVLARSCPYCNTPIGMASITSKENIRKLNQDYDHFSNTLFLLSVIIPLFGLIVSRIKGEEETLKAKSAISGFLVGTVIYLAIIALIMVLNLIK